MFDATATLQYNKQMPHHDHHRHDHRDHRPVSPPFSLLTLSSAQRLAGAGVLLAALWAIVLWAMV